MQIAVFQFVVFAHQQVTEELFEVFRLLLDSFSHILVVRSDKGIPEIPRIFGEMSFPTLKPLERRYLMIKTAVVRVLPVQYPFFFGNIVLADFSSMFEHPLEKPLVNSNQKRG